MNSDQTLQTTLHTDPSALDALEPHWVRLQKETAHRSIFLSYDWFRAAWAWKRSSAKLYLLACQRGDAVVGILPLVKLSRNGTRLRPRVLEFLAIPDTQRCDILAAKQDEEPVAEALATALKRDTGAWDVLRLRALRDGAIASTSFGAALARQGLHYAVVRTGTNPSIALNEGWTRYYASRSRRFKKGVNLVANRLTKAGAIEVRWLAPGTGTAQELERAVADAIAISAKSWKTDTGNSLDREGPQSFLRELARRMHAGGSLAIWTLALDDAPVAMELQLVHEGEVFALRSDFDTRYDALSPGSYLSRNLIERLCENACSRYFMGPGENAYKYRWADGGEPVYAMSVYSRSSRGRLLRTWETLIKPALRRLRDRFTAPAMAPQGDPDIAARVDAPAPA